MHEDTSPFLASLHSSIASIHGLQVVNQVDALASGAASKEAAASRPVAASETERNPLGIRIRCRPDSRWVCLDRAGETDRDHTAMERNTFFLKNAFQA
jgi:hypothetical protein